MENKEFIFKLPENCEVHGNVYTNAKVEEVYLCVNRNTPAAIDLIYMLNHASGINYGTNVIYSIEMKETGGWMHIGVTDTEIHIGQSIRVVSF